MFRKFTMLIAAVMLFSMLPAASFAMADTLSEDETWSLVEEAYTYVFPLVLMDATETVSTNVEAPDLKGHAPVNQLIHVQKLATAESKLVVTPNVDTIYTQAWLDLAAEPMVLVLPEADRFFNVQVLDAWTNTPAVLDDAGAYAFVTPSWSGELPEGVTRVETPTETVWLIARILLNGEADINSVREIQGGMSLMPLSAYASGEVYQPEAGSYSPENSFVPVEKVLSMSLQSYFDTANKLMLTNPPAEADADLLERLTAIGVGPSQTFNAEAIPGDRPARYKEMLKGLRAKLVAAGQEYTVKMGSWQYFDAPIGDFGTAYTYRAMVALGGLGANTVDVAVYPKTNVDASGNTLTGANSYTLHMDTLPPTLEGGFWSITAYGSDDFLIDNAMNRYCINDRSECQLNEDGSLDITLSFDAPEDTANWLPISQDEFHLYLRVYYPDMDALANWTAPVITANKG